MQLVLSNNRVIAHGENFIAMGGTVINTVTGAKYENATVAECEGCPSDIDSVGYEYHAGQFIPCAPYGNGDNNGYFMEVCKGCATPRNSGIKIQEYKDLKEHAYGLDWETLAEISINQSGEKAITVDFGVDAETLHNYTEVAIVVVEGMELKCGPRGNDNARISCGSYKIFCEADTGTQQYVSGSFTLPTAVQLWSAHLQHNIIATFKQTGALPINWTVTPTDFMNVIIGTKGNASVKGNILLKGRKIKCI